MGPIIAYSVGGGLFVILAMLLYLRSSMSEKRYTCPSCGEAISVELMEARNCASCGAALPKR